MKPLFLLLFFVLFTGCMSGRKLQKNNRKTAEKTETQTDGFRNQTENYTRTITQTQEFLDSLKISEKVFAFSVNWEKGTEINTPEIAVSLQKDSAGNGFLKIIQKPKTVPIAGRQTTVTQENGQFSEVFKTSEKILKTQKTTEKTKEKQTKYNYLIPVLVVVFILISLFLFGRKKLLEYF